MSRPVCVTPSNARPASVLRSGAPLWRWPRLLPDPLAAYAEELRAEPWFAVRVSAPVRTLAPALAAALDEAGIAATPGREALTTDVVELARSLATTARASHAKVRVEHDPGGMCPVFHHDNNVVRLLCTYAGPGTEWLPEDRLDRSQLGLQGRRPADANQAIAWAEPMRARPGEVLIVKGARYSTGHRSLVHKSPAPELGDRIFVSIDPVHESRAQRRRTSLRRQRSCA